MAGWLILPAIGLFLIPVRSAVILNNDFLLVFQKGLWKVLTTPGSEAYHHLWGPLIVFEMAGNVFFILFDIALLYLFFTKSYRFPLLSMAFWALNLLFAVSDLVLADFIPAVAARRHAAPTSEIFRSIAGAAIWIPYFLVSKRVKNTFVKPECNVVLQPTSVSGIVARMKLSELERAILDWISEREPDLAERLRDLRPLRRRFTGTGCYTHFRLESGSGVREHVDGPIIESPALKQGGWSLLWLAGGEPDMLEVYAFSDRFPEELQDFKLGR